MKSGLKKKLARKWDGPFKVTKKISQLNYEIVSQKDKSLVVHINRLKKAYNQDLWKPKLEQDEEIAKTAGETIRSD
jgi:hypothetical protein